MNSGERIMKKTLLASIVAGLLVGCGGGGGEEPEKVEVVVSDPSQPAKTSADLTSGKRIAPPVQSVSKTIVHVPKVQTKVDDKRKKPEPLVPIVAGESKALDVEKAKEETVTVDVSTIPAEVQNSWPDPNEVPSIDEAVERTWTFDELSSFQGQVLPTDLAKYFSSISDFLTFCDVNQCYRRSKTDDLGGVHEEQRLPNHADPTKSKLYCDRGANQGRLNPGCPAVYEPTSYPIN